MVVRLPPKAPPVSASSAVAMPTAISETAKRAQETRAPAAATHPVATSAPSSPLLDPFNLPTNPVSAVTAGIQVGQWNRPGAKLVTASDVERALNGDLSSAFPGVPAAMHPMIKGLAQALGRDGPLGSHGPLGVLGPAADEPWSPSFWMNKVGDWTELSDKLAKSGGPGSSRGPLGPDGPLGDSKLDPALLAELQAGGLFAPLGPLGPLGALGALGYLGLIGGHGYARNDAGHFVDREGKVVRTAKIVDGDGGTKNFELVELYPEKTAKAARIHDASWAIRGAIGAEDADGDSFRFAAKKGQLITLTVVPEKQGDTMTVELLRHGKVIARSESDRLVNWIQLEADRSGTLEVRVRKKEGVDAAAPHPASVLIDWMLMPLVTWGEAVRPWVGAPPKQQGTGYRLYSTSTPPQKP